MMRVAAARFDPRVEAALFARYGVDVLDTQSVSLRRLRWLLELLPPGFWQDQESDASWSQESHLLACVVDALRGLQWQNANRGSKHPDPQPPPFPRPGDEARARAARERQGGGLAAWWRIFAQIGGRA